MSGLKMSKDLWPLFDDFSLVLQDVDRLAERFAQRTSVDITDVREALASGLQFIAKEADAYAD